MHKEQPQSTAEEANLVKQSGYASNLAGLFSTKQAAVERQVRAAASRR